MPLVRIPFASLVLPLVLRSDGPRLAWIKPIRIACEYTFEFGQHCFETHTFWHWELRGKWLRIQQQQISSTHSSVNLYLTGCNVLCVRVFGSELWGPLLLYDPGDIDGVSGCFALRFGRGFRWFIHQFHFDWLFLGVNFNITSSIKDLVQNLNRLKKTWLTCDTLFCVRHVRHGPNSRQKLLRSTYVTMTSSSLLKFHRSEGCTCLCVAARCPSTRTDWMSTWTPCLAGWSSRCLAGWS